MAIEKKQIIIPRVNICLSYLGSSNQADNTIKCRSSPTENPRKRPHEDGNSNTSPSSRKSASALKQEGCFQTRYAQSTEETFACEASSFKACTCEATNASLEKFQRILQRLEERIKTQQQEIDGLKTINEKNTASLQPIYNELEIASSSSRKLEKKVNQQAQDLRELFSDISFLLDIASGEDCEWSSTTSKYRAVAETIQHKHTDS